MNPDFKPTYPIKDPRYDKLEYNRWSASRAAYLIGELTFLNLPAFRVLFIQKDVEKAFESMSIDNKILTNTVVTNLHVYYRDNPDDEMVFYDHFGDFGDVYTDFTKSHPTREWFVQFQNIFYENINMIRLSWVQEIYHDK